LALISYIQHVKSGVITFSAFYTFLIKFFNRIDFPYIVSLALQFESFD